MNLPNKLTVFRIALVPVCVFVWLFPYSSFHIAIPVFQIGHVSISLINLIVLLIFSTASFTDMLDGKIARGRNLVTTFGKFADPIADKILVNTMLVIMANKGILPVVPVVIMLCRDTVVDGCRMLAASNGVVIAAGNLGKMKTVLQMITIILALLNNLPFELINLPVSELMTWVCAFVSAAGGYTYFSQVKDFIFESM